MDPPCVTNTESTFIPRNDHVSPNPNPNPNPPINPNPNPIDDIENGNSHPHISDYLRLELPRFSVLIPTMIKEIQEKRREMAQKGKKKRKIEEVTEIQQKGKEVKEPEIEEVATGSREKPENLLIIRDLPALSLPPLMVVMALRNLIRLTVGVSQPSQPLKPVILSTDSNLIHPYPWKELSIEQMAEKGFQSVEGEVECSDCGEMLIVSLDWREAMVKSASFILANFINFGEEMYSNWIPPSDIQIECGVCNEKVVPIIDPTIEMNWLFLFLTNLISYVPVPILEEYIRSRPCIQLSETPSKKELMFGFYIAMLHLLDPGGGWGAMHDSFANKQVKD